MGSLCSILLILVVGVFTFQKIDIWLNKKDVDIVSSISSGYFTSDYIFNHEMGLSFAIAFTAYDSEREDILDASYGNLQFTSYEWYEDEDGNPQIEFVDIPSHTCSREELGLDNDGDGDNNGESLFYPIEKDKRNLVGLYQ